jgi:hypothetical protein
MLAEGRRGLPAIDALAEMGDTAVVAMDDALDDPAVGEETKWRILRALSRSSSAQAVPRLSERLARTRDTALVSRILRALRGAQTAGVHVPVDDGRLRDLAGETISAVARAIAFRLAHARLLEATPAHRTTVAELLQKLLRDKETEGIDRLFLVLGLLHPAERFARIQRGLSSANVKARASGRELIENVLTPPLRDRVLALVDDVSDRERLSRLGTERTEDSYRALLAAMIEQGGELGVLASYHATELGFRDSGRDAAGGLDATTAFGSEAATKPHEPREGPRA